MSCSPKFNNFIAKIFLISHPREAFVLAMGITLLFCVPWHSFGLEYILNPSKEFSKGAVQSFISALVLFRIALLGPALTTMLRQSIPAKRLRTATALLSILIPGMPAMLLSAVLLKQKRNLFASLALIDIAATIYALFFALSFKTFFGFLCVSFVFSSCAAIGYREDKKTKFNEFAFLPFAVAAAGWLLLCGETIRIRSDIEDEKKAISRLLGYDVSYREYRKREAGGLLVESEPFRTLNASAPEEKIWFFPADPKKNRENLEILRERHGVFLKALHDFLKLPVSHFTHSLPKGSLYFMPLCEVGTLLRGTDALLLELSESEGDPAKVRECSENLRKLRDWLLAGNSLISKLAGFRIEEKRLRMIGGSFFETQFTKEELPALLGPEPEYGRIIADMFGTEVSAFESLVEDLTEGNGSLEEYTGENSSGFLSGKSFILCPDLWFLRDFRYALKKYHALTVIALRNADLPESIFTGPESPEYREVKKNFYILSAMLFPASDAIFSQRNRLESLRKMIVPAFEISEYLRTHSGNFPSEEEVHHEESFPFLYERVELNFSDGTKHFGFRLIPGGKALTEEKKQKEGLYVPLN